MCVYLVLNEGNFNIKNGVTESQARPYGHSVITSKSRQKQELLPVPSSVGRP